MNTESQSPLTRDEIRARFLNRARKMEDLAEDLPGLEDLTPVLALQELSAAATVHINRLANDHGQDNEGLNIAGLVAKSLILKNTHERIFSDKDLQAISEMGLSVLTPLVKRIKTISSLSEDSLDDATKNLNQTTDSNSPSSSQES